METDNALPNNRAASSQVSPAANETQYTSPGSTVAGQEENVLRKSQISNAQVMRNSQVMQSSQTTQSDETQYTSSGSVVSSGQEVVPTRKRNQTQQKVQAMLSQRMWPMSNSPTDTQHTSSGSTVAAQAPTQENAVPQLSQQILSIEHVRMSEFIEGNAYAEEQLYSPNPLAFSEVENGNIYTENF